MTRLLLFALTAPAAAAQIAIVQTKSIHAEGTAPVTFTFATAPSAHDLLVVGCSLYSGATVTAPDSTWTRQAYQTSSDVALAVWTHAVASGEANAYAFTQNNHTTCTAYDLSGAAFYAPINQSAVALSTTASVTSLLTPAVTPTVAGTLPLAFVAMDDDTVSAVGSPWTYTAPAAGAHPLGAASHALTTDTTTAQSATFTVAGANADGLAAATLLIAPYNSTPIAPVASPAGLGGVHYSSIIGQPVSFDGSTSSDPKLEALTYLWTFGDGATSTAVQPTHTYATAATFNASLKVTNTDGLSNTASFTVIVQTGPSVMSLGFLANLNGFVPFANDEMHRDHSALPNDPNDAALHAAIQATHIHADWGVGPYGNYGFGYNIVNSAITPMVPYQFFDPKVNESYPGQSDVTVAPLLLSQYIESQPADCASPTGDNHSLVLDQGTGVEYDFYHMRHCSTDAIPFTVSASTLWDMTVSNQHRPLDYTSADLAGLPIFEGLVRWDEIQAGVINHAVRMTNNLAGCLYYQNGSGKGGFILPATHSTVGNCSGNNGNGFNLGQFWCLDPSYDISGFSATNQIILTALKTKCGYLADLGGSFYFSGTADTRWDQNDLANLGNVPVSAFHLKQQAAIYADGSYPSGTPPTIGSFAPALPVLTTGQCTTLNFSVTGASYQYIDLVGFVRTAPTVCPTVTTTYTLTASNYFLVNDDGTGDGTRPTATATVTVLPAVVPFFSGNVIVGNQQ